MVDILTVTFPSFAGLNHFSSSGVSLGSTLLLFRFGVVGFILFFVVSRSCHDGIILPCSFVYNPLRDVRWTYNKAKNVFFYCVNLRIILS